jgi:hypothetical protein
MMRKSRVVSFGAMLGCASAALLGWRPAIAAFSHNGSEQSSAMIGDGGQPQIGRGDSEAGLAEESARHLPLLWEAGGTSAGDVGPTSAWKAGPTVVRGDDAGL